MNGRRGVEVAREIRDDERFMEELAEILAASFHSWQGSDQEKSLRFAEDVEEKVRRRFREDGALSADSEVFLHGLFFGVMTMASVDISQDEGHRAG